MAKSAQKIASYALRRQGKSINEIATLLHVSKGTVSGWVRDLPLTSAQRKRLRENTRIGGHEGRAKGAAMNREKKQRLIAQCNRDALRQISRLSQRDLLLLGLGLYWGEGIKSSGTRVAIVNSDPQIIRVSKRWLTECLGVSSERLRPVIFINESHKLREQDLLRYWSRLLQIPITQFSKTVFLKQPHKKVYENHTEYHGILTLRVARPAELKYKILGLLAALATRAIKI